MKILMLTPYLPYPLYSGGQIRSYHLLKNLSYKHEITLFSFIRSPEEKKYLAKLEEFCQEVKVFLKSPPWSLKSLFLSALTVYPLVVCMYWKKSLKKEIEKAIDKNQFDLIHAETFYVMPNIPKCNIPVILVEQTIEYRVYQHYTENICFPPLRWMMRYDVSKIRFWEKNFWQKAACVVAMSEADKKEMQKLVKNLKVDLAPNGVDFSFFAPKNQKKEKKKEKIILFVGNFKWLQNREAVSILVKKVWPIIKKHFPEAKLWIVGRSPTREILSYTSSSIVVSSHIEDIRVAYYNSDVLLAPIYGPGGTRYKILEAMAAGLPVVTTPTGIEGLGASAGEEVLVAEDPPELARQTLELLRNTQLYWRLSHNAQKLVKENFNWEKIAKTLDEIYEKAVREDKNETFNHYC